MALRPRTARSVASQLFLGAAVVSMAVLLAGGASPAARGSPAPASSVAHAGCHEPEVLDHKTGRCVAPGSHRKWGAVHAFTFQTETVHDVTGGHGVTGRRKHAPVRP
ncbi:MAG: hypothetical protein ACHP7N_13605 [Caulobacterales bacterium]